MPLYEEFKADIDLQVAISAHSGTSHVPQERGHQEVERYASTLQKDWEWVMGVLANKEELSKPAITLFEEYRAGLKKRFMARLHADARCISPMITGPARFPVDRNRKRMATSDKRTTECIEWRDRCLKKLKDLFFPEYKPIRSTDGDAVQRLQAQIDEAEQLQKRMKELNLLWRQVVDSPQDRLKAVQAVATPAEFEEIVKNLKYSWAGVPFPPYALTNNNANIRRMKGRVASITAEAEARAKVREVLQAEEAANPSAATLWKNADYEITERIHTKRCSKYWQVELTSRVEKERFEELRQLAQAMRGWYSKQWKETPGGFAFNSPEEALAFAKKAFEKKEVMA